MNGILLMEKNFLLSIVVPVYNEENYISAVFEKLLAVKFQDGVDVEIIAVYTVSFS